LPFKYGVTIQVRDVFEWGGCYIYFQRMVGFIGIASASPALRSGSLHPSRILLGHILRCKNSDCGQGRKCEYIQRLISGRDPGVTEELTQAVHALSFPQALAVRLLATFRQSRDKSTLDRSIAVNDHQLVLVTHGAHKIW
jgi:hypothetical protein